MTPRVLVVDLDSALEGADGRVDARDRRALERAQRAGVHLAFATSRRAGAAQDRLRALALRGWVIGTDGTEIERPDGACVTRHALPASVAARSLPRTREMGLKVFVITPAALHGALTDRDLATATLGPLADRYAASAALVADVSGFVAMGAPERVAEAHALLLGEAPNRMTSFVFRSGASDALRVRPLRATRAQSIQEICARLGVRRGRIAYVGGSVHPCGDWTGFLVCRATYAIQGAAIGPARGATRLERSAGEGALEEAIERWLEGAREVQEAPPEVAS